MTLRTFRDISLGRKVMLIILLTSGTVLLLAFATVITYDQISLRQRLASDLETQATVLGDNSTAALVFSDHKGAAEVLAVLRQQSHIVAAIIYGRDGKPFATYLRRGVPATFAPTLPDAEGSYFRNRRLVDLHYIAQSEETLGAIYIESDVEELSSRLRRYTRFLGFVLLSAFLVAAALAHRLQRLISEPILELVSTAQQIAAEKNYHLRAASSGSDELGLLVLRFNEMLAQIQHRDQELERQRSNLQKEVAARTVMNKQLEAAKEQAEAASYAKGEFLANMSHEIRTPINGILGMTELVLETELTQDQKDCLSMAKSSGESLLSLINDILDFSKAESGHMELDPIQFSVYNCVGETMKALALRAHQKGLELAYDVAQEVPLELIGDPGRLRQVLVNLVGNAIKFTDKGEVIVKVRSSAEENRQVELTFSVTDTGIGIPPEKQPILFQAFSQADSGITRKYGGTGLGLAISRRLVELMGGKIWLDSQAGRGSSFHFTAHFGVAAVAVEPAAPVADYSRLRDVRLLIVDDNETNRRILFGLTSLWGMIPAAVESGQAALAAVESALRNQEPFRVVLVDACMPVMDGFQLAEKLHAEHSSLSNMTILMLTSAGRAGEAARCKQLGISAYLLKPVMKADLRTAILTVLGQDGGASQPLVTRHTMRESSRKLRILIAEDNAINQALIIRVLAKLGHASVMVNNGKEAVTLISTEKFDLVFMDVQMPEMDGLSATAAIRESEKSSGKHVPIVAMTAYAMQGDQERCLDAGMDAYIAKPVRFSDIEETLANLDNLATRNGAAMTIPVEVSLPDKKEIRPAYWDQTEALERLGGDVELLQDLCVIFLQESPNLMKKLENALLARNAEGIARAAHSLKGEVSYLMASRATQAARRMETTGMEGNFSQATEVFATLKSEIESLRLTLQDYTGVPQ